MEILIGFNPLDRGNSNQIMMRIGMTLTPLNLSFNPLDRGNSNQIHL